MRGLTGVPQLQRQRDIEELGAPKVHYRGLDIAYDEVHLAAAVVRDEVFEVDEAEPAAGVQEDVARCDVAVFVSAAMEVFGKSEDRESGMHG